MKIWTRDAISKQLGKELYTIVLNAGIHLNYNLIENRCVDEDDYPFEHYFVLDEEFQEDMEAVERFSKQCNEVLDMFLPDCRFNNQTGIGFLSKSAIS